MSNDNGRIKLLSEDVANKIAAGEVVERPSSVVKELVENALDAGARRVSVEIKEGGRKLIAVSDDGCGMAREDACMSLQRHATSKIRTAADISDVRTLGFRGEALPSIASVSRFEIVTAPQDGSQATLIRVEGGGAPKISDGARSQGTTVSVKDLFFCVPARAKFLKTDVTELGHIARFLQNAVLSHPYVGFRYQSDGKVVFDLPPQTENVPFMDAVLTRISQLRGKDFARSLIRFGASEEGRIAEGFVSPWTIASSTRQEILFFVNQRAVRCVWLAALLKRAYGTLLSAERFPYAFIFLTVSPRTIDINVHPSKLDIRFRSEHLVQDLIARSVSEALRKDMAPPSLALKEKTDGTEAAYFPRPREFDPGREKLTVEDWKKIYGLGEPAEKAVEEKPAETYAAPEEKGTLASSRALAQAGGMYILAEIEGRGIGIIDQHAAHERINYELALRAFESARAPSQALLLPETLPFSPEEMTILGEHLDELRKGGFVIEEFGKRELKVDAIPAFLEASALQELFRDIANDLKILGSSARTEEIRRRLALTMVCRKSIKFHHQLSLADCQKLLDDLMACKTPWTCPHGRPTVVMLTYSELERRFGRAGL